MELIFCIDDESINELSSKLGLSYTNITKEAFTILNWAVKERLQGRVILSSDSEGQDVKRLAMESLDNLNQ